LLPFGIGIGLKSFKQGLEEAGEEFKSEFSDKKE
jgi:hypothetical protein